MSKDYAVEKLYQATLSLVGDGSIKQRLYSAGLTLVTRQIEGALSREEADELRSIHSALTRESARFEGDGRLDASIAKMTDDEAADLSERIFHLYGKVLHGNSL